MEEREDKINEVTVFGHKDLTFCLNTDFKLTHKKFSITNNI